MRRLLLSLLLFSPALAANQEDFYSALTQRSSELFTRLATETALNIVQEIGISAVKGLLGQQNPQPNPANFAPQTLRDLAKSASTLQGLANLYSSSNASNQAELEEGFSNLGNFTQYCATNANVPECKAESADPLEEPKSVGIVSYIEGLPNFTPTGGNLMDHVPNVHFIQTERYRACLQKAMDERQCQRFEWRAPLMPEENAQRLERTFSELWNRYDAIRYWRTQLSLFGGGPIFCAIPIPDITLSPYDGLALNFIGGDEICDGWTPPLLPPLWLPGICGTSFEVIIDWNDVINRWSDAWVSSVNSHLIRRYWTQAGEAILSNAPGALYWDGLYPITGINDTSGLVLVPIGSFTPNVQQYLDMMLQTVNTDPIRGAAYWVQAVPRMYQVRQILRKLPVGDKGISSLHPGYQAIEALKRNLTDREGIFDRFYQYYDVLGIFGGARPQGKSGVATPLEYEIFGAVPLFYMTTRWVWEMSPRGAPAPLGVPFTYACNQLSLAPPFVSPSPRAVYLPLMNVGPRIETGWMTVPEGHSIADVKGVPTQLLDMIGVGP